MANGAFVKSGDVKLGSQDVSCISKKTGESRITPFSNAGAALPTNASTCRLVGADFVPYF